MKWLVLLLACVLAGCTTARPMPERPQYADKRCLYNCERDYSLCLGVAPRHRSTSRPMYYQRTVRSYEYVSKEDVSRCRDLLEQCYGLCVEENSR